MYVDTHLERSMVVSAPTWVAERQLDTARKPAGLNGMHPGVYAISVAGWVWLIASCWAVFGTDSQAAFVVAVSTLFIIVFYGLAAALMGLNRVDNDNRGGSFADFMRAGIDTLTGQMSGVAALIQVALIPISLGAGTMVMAIIITLAR
jgi:hypothetical protein